MTELVIPRTRIAFRETTYALNTLCLETPESWKHGGIVEMLKKENQNYYKVSIKPYRNPRSTGQNSQCNHFNGHVRQICEATGNSFELAKLAIKKRAVDEMGYPYENILGSVVPKSEGEANSAEAAILIELTHLIAAELGIHLKEK